MTDIEKLITAARHYCIDNFALWLDKYSRESSGKNNPYSDNDYNLFSRYHVINAIQEGVETLVGQEFSSFEHCKQALAGIGQNSHSISTIGSNDDLHLLGESGRFKRRTGQQNPIEKRAMDEERIKFIEFIHSRTTDHISEVKPLPYEHRLTDQEMVYVRQKLLEIWNYDGYDYWNPLANKSPTETVFLMKKNLTNSDCNQIVGYLISHCENRIYEITEDRVDYEIEFDSFDLDLHETIVSDRTFEWVIYGSHEGTITFGGAALIDFIKKLFADRKDRLNKYGQKEF